MDSTLLLQAIFHFQESLIRQQQQCRISIGGKIEYIVDDLFLLRNMILSSTYLMGGPTERSPPLLDLTDKPSIFQIPVDPAYLPDNDYKFYFEITHTSHQALSAYLDSCKDSSFSKHDLAELQNHFKSCLVESKTVPVQLCRKILLIACQILSISYSEKRVERKVPENCKTNVAES